MTSLANLEVEQTNLSRLLGYVWWKTSTIKVCVVDKLISLSKNLFTQFCPWHWKGNIYWEFKAEMKYWNAALRFGRQSNASVCLYVVWEPGGSADPSTSSFFFLVWPTKTQGCMEMNTFSPYSPNLRALLLDFIPNSHCQWSKSQRRVATSIIYIKYVPQFFCQMPRNDVT